MTKSIAGISQRKTARMAGFLYLVYIITFAFSSFIQKKPIVPGNAAATAGNIMAAEWLFRIGFMSELLAVLFFLLTAWALYVLLKPVNKSLALLFVLLNLGGVAIESINTLIYFVPLLTLGSADYLKVFKADQLQALAMLFLNINGSGNIILVLFYGAWLFPLGYLVVKSGFLPRILGILLILDGFCFLICFFQLCLFPGYEKITYPLYPVMFIAECGFALWLLIKGVKLPAIDCDFDGLDIDDEGQCIEEFNLLNEQNSNFIASIEREDICAEFEEIAYVCSLGQYDDPADRWRDC